MDSLPSRLFISLAFLAMIAVFRAAKISIDEVNEARIQRFFADGGKRAARVMWIIERKSRFHATINLLFVLLITAIITLCCDSLFYFSITQHKALVSVLTLIVADILIAVVGIYTPGKFAKNTADNTALALSLIAKISMHLLSPFVIILTAISNFFLRIMRINPDIADEDDVTEEEIRMMVDIGSSSGAIDPEEKEMINNIFEFDDTPAKDIMTHRTNVEFLWLEDDIETWEKSMSETNHSIYPVCDESVDNIIGILSSKDFYRMLRSNDINIKSILKTPFFVPESIKADDLFRQMQKNKSHFAVVLDEYGGLGGIITISDLLEEIVGTLSNDDGSEEDDIVQIDEYTWKIAGAADIDLVSETLGVELPVEEYNTFAGMILGELGTIPDDGTTPSLEAYGLTIKVLKIEDHRIESARVGIISPEPSAKE